MVYPDIKFSKWALSMRGSCAPLKFGPKFQKMSMGMRYINLYVFKDAEHEYDVSFSIEPHPKPLAPPQKGQIPKILIVLCDT